MYRLVMIRYQNFNFDTISIRYFENDKYVNLMQAQEQDKNFQQGSLLCIDTKMCQ